MITCPSCNFTSPIPSDYCIRCGFAAARLGPRIARLRDTLAWVLRRSLAGFATGLVGWWIIPAAGRAAGTSLSQSAHFLLSGGLGGFFLGSVEGMLEESTLKSVRGGLAGLLGGLLGSVIAAWVVHGGKESAGMTAVIATWAAAGAAIGLVSAIMERKPTRVAAGFVAGLLGGALGGWLGYQMYASLMDIARPEWGLKRLIEGSTGAILGTVLWAVLGLGEKLFVFRRTIVQNVSYKECETCHHANVLKAWYCAMCGAVLQVFGASGQAGTTPAPVFGTFHRRLSVPRTAGRPHLHDHRASGGRLSRGDQCVPRVVRAPRPGPHRLYRPRPLQRPLRRLKPSAIIGS